MSYQPIAVDVAREIAERHGKDMLLILAYDHATRTTNSVTWGRSPQDKEIAVDAANRCVKTLGGDLETERTHEDYRFLDEGRRAQIIDDLVRSARSAHHAIQSVLAVRNGISDGLLQDVCANLDEAIANAKLGGTS